MLFRNRTPHLTLFSKIELNGALNILNISPKVKHSTLFINGGRYIFSIYIVAKAVSVHKNDQHVQGWNPTTIFLENWTQWCMTDSPLTPHFKYSTMRCFQNRNMFSIYRPTRAKSVHKNDQHVQGKKPTTIFFENRKNSKKRKTKKRIKNDIYVCW